MTPDQRGRQREAATAAQRVRANRHVTYQMYHHSQYSQAQIRFQIHADGSAFGANPATQPCHQSPGGGSQQGMGVREAGGLQRWRLSWEASVVLFLCLTIAGGHLTQRLQNLGAETKKQQDKAGSEKQSL